MTAAVFDHDKLRVYQDAIAFVSWSSELAGANQLGGTMAGQLERAAASVALNIAEGNGKSYRAERCRFLEMARGSAFECAACLDVLVAQKRITETQAHDGKVLLHGVIGMLTGLIASVAGRTAEEPSAYSFPVAGNCALDGEDEKENENEKENGE